MESQRMNVRDKEREKKKGEREMDREEVYK